MFNFSLENILHSNLINFLILVAIFVFLFFALKVSGKFEDACKKEEDKINKSNSDLEASKQRLKNTQEKYAKQRIFGQHFK